MSRFKRLAATPIDSLGVTVHEFEHETGASYLHFEADHPEHAFWSRFARFLKIQRGSPTFLNTRRCAGASATPFEIRSSPCCAVRCPPL